MENRKIDILLQKLKEGVQGVFESDSYKAWLISLSHFHRYSWRNSILIMRQMPEASLVNSYKGWKKLGRHVLAGQHGIGILVPTPVKVKSVARDADDETDEEKHTILRFKVGHVWDISQTDGDPLPSPGINELHGTVDGYNRFIEAAKTISPVPVSFEEIRGSAKGFYDPNAKKIVVQSGMSECQSAKTIIHEISHSLLHSNEKMKADNKKSRETMEIEAESVAFVCMNAILGVDSSEYSFGYVASWSSGKDVMELTKSLKRIHDTSAELITAFEDTLKGMRT